MLPYAGASFKEPHTALLDETIGALPAARNAPQPRFPGRHFWGAMFFPGGWIYNLGHSPVMLPDWSSP